MTKTIEINPVLAESLGYDLEAASNEDVVTVVRRRVILEEVVISKEQYEKINSEIDSDEGMAWSQLDWKDAEWSDYSDENTSYTAFPGDVTSFSDDCVNFYDNDWFDNYDKISLNTFEHF